MGGSGWARETLMIVSQGKEILCCG